MNRVRQLRRKRRMTQHQVAMATGLPQGTISYIERLRRGKAPNLDHARLIAAALGVTVDEIFPPAATKTSSVDRKVSQEPPVAEAVEP